MSIFVKHNIFLVPLSLILVYRKVMMANLIFDVWRLGEVLVRFRRFLGESYVAMHYYFYLNSIR